MLLVEGLLVFLAEVLHLGGLIDEVDGRLLMVLLVIQIRLGFEPVLGRYHRHSGARLRDDSRRVLLQLVVLLNLNHRVA